MINYSYSRLILLSFLSSCTILSCSDQNGKTAEPQKTTVSSVEGERIFKRCSTCHTLEDGGRARTGPNLYGIFGAQAGSKKNFTRYSAAMAKSEIIWNEDNMREYLRNPAKFMPGTNMSFAGLRKDEQLDAVIDYLKAETSR